MNSDKILFLADFQADFGVEMLWDGLCRLIGSENVVTYPYIKHYYGKVDDDYILDNGQKGWTAPGDYMPLREELPWSREQILDRIKEFKLAVLTSPRTYAIEALVDLKDSLTKRHIPLAFTDFEDSTTIRQDIIDFFNPRYVFKRELLNHIPNTKIVPLPFSSFLYSDQYPDKKEKDIDVFFMCGNTWPLRLEIRDMLVGLNDERIIAGCDDKETKLSYREYIDAMSRAKINIVARGHGIDTVRRWEAPSFSGVVLSDRLPLVTPFPFMDKLNIVYYDSVTHLKELIKQLLADKLALKQIGEMGQYHLHRWHTTKERARYFLRECQWEEEIGDNNLVEEILANAND